MPVSGDGRRSGDVYKRQAVAMALENHKALRSTMADETHIKISSRIHIGVAVDIPGGLIVPVTVSYTHLKRNDSRIRTSVHWPGSVSGRCGGRPEKDRL